MNSKLNLHPGEVCLFDNKPDRKFFNYKAILSLSGIIGFFLLAAIFVYINTPKLNDFSLPHFLKQPNNLLLGFFFLVALLQIFLQMLSIGNIRYIITNQRCIIYSGTWTKNRKIIPYHQILDVDMNQNTLQRFLGIASVYLIQQRNYLSLVRRNSVSSGGAFEGLDIKNAEKVMDLISQHINQTKR